MTEVRLAFTISGAVSLGAFEGGALAALLAFAQDLAPDDGSDWPVTIDVMSGASAGSITAVLAARILTAGLDPLTVMHDTWVTAPSLSNLGRGARKAPLSATHLRQQAEAMLSRPALRRPQPRPVTVHMALTSLGGLRYLIPDLATNTPLTATTHLDWGEFTFEPEATVDTWLTPPGASAVDMALASGANALGFPPYALNRKARPDDWATYERNGVTGLPDDGWIWYTDGGTIENEPLGRTLDLAARADAGTSARRVHVLIHPHPTGTTAVGPWMGQNEPTAPWLRAAARADQIQRTQTLFDDLRRAEKTNSRLTWRAAFEAWLLAHRDSLDPSARATFDDGLDAVLSAIRDDKAALSAQVDATRSAPAPRPRPDPEMVLSSVLDQVTGSAGTPAEFAVISPLIIATELGATVEDILAGESLMHFGGFLDDRLRAHDFAVGYAAACGWLATAVAGDGAIGSLPQEAAESALSRVRARQPTWSLPAPIAGAAGKRAALRVAVRAAALAIRDLAVWRPWRRRR